MALKLMYITNQEEIAKIAENSGVDWVFVDLESNGKEKRQENLDSVISKHKITDVKKIKQVLTSSELLVRVNPIFDGSKKEIDNVIKDGADIVMLPYFKTKKEVELFVKFVDDRAKVCLLCETSEAVENIDSILKINGIDYIHIGLNDLHLSYNMKFMFELVVDGTVEMLSEKIGAKGIPFGFGGIAQLGYGDIPAENIIAEHHRLGSEMAILSRSFCDTNKISDLNQIIKIFRNGVGAIRNYEHSMFDKDNAFLEKNHAFIKRKVSEIIYS